MGEKKWFQSKTVWAGIIAVLIAVYNAVLASLSSQCGVEGAVCVTLPAIPEWVFGILGALGVYGRTSATTTIK